MDTRRNLLKKKQRVVIKIGSSSLQHTETGDMDYIRLEVLVRELCNLKNQGKDVVLVSSGAIAQGKKAVHLTPEQLQEHPIAVKQACAAVGQARLMMTYQKIFAEYNQVTAQILMTRQTISNDTNRINAQNTFEELFRMGVIPIVNENDTVAVDELEGRNFGDNDTLSAIVASIINADVLMILTDIDGVYDKNPKAYPDAKRLSVIEKIDDEVRAMAGGAGSARGTGGLATKSRAAEIAGRANIPTYILSGEDPENLYRIFDGEDIGTVFMP